MKNRIFLYSFSVVFLALSNFLTWFWSNGRKKALNLDSTEAQKQFRPTYSPKLLMSESPKKSKIEIHSNRTLFIDLRRLCLAKCTRCCWTSRNPRGTGSNWAGSTRIFACGPLYGPHSTNCLTWRPDSTARIPWAWALVLHAVTGADGWLCCRWWCWCGRWCGSWHAVRAT